MALVGDSEMTTDELINQLIQVPYDGQIVDDVIEILREAENQR